MSSRIRRVGLACLAASGVLVSSTQATAQVELQLADGVAPSVHVEVPAGVRTSEVGGELLTRLVAELRAAGFTVVLSDTAALPASSFGHVRVSVDGARLRLDIGTRSTAASTRAVLVGRRGEVGALALQATEFLRAGLVPGLESPRYGTSEPDEPRTRDVARDRAAPRWLADWGVSMLTNWGVGDALPLTSAGVGYVFSSPFLLRLTADVPVGAAEYQTERGSADYRTWLVGAQAGYAWLRGRRGFASVELCAGAAHVSSAGSPRPPLLSLTDSTWTAHLGAGASAELRFSSHIGFVGQLRLLTMSPSPIVAIRSDERRLGSPSIMVTLGLRVGSELGEPIAVDTTKRGTSTASAR